LEIELDLLALGGWRSCRRRLATNAAFVTGGALSLGPNPSALKPEVLSSRYKLQLGSHKRRMFSGIDAKAA
jgi:hypothetical protein